MKMIRFILFPISLLYGCIIVVRNICYDIGIFSSKRFSIPIIVIGNLSMGGTGKTPLIEYLIRILQPAFPVATLSRGYGRKTKGFVLAKEDSLYTEIGDEPKQFKNKFKDVVVAVDNKRVRGINKLLAEFSQQNTILLDDAFQHRAISPGISILLTEYNKLFIHDYIIPTGNLREPRKGSNRADAIVVTKTPAKFSPIERKRLYYELKPKSYQKLFFSYLEYGDFIPFNKTESTPFGKEYYFDRDFHILLVTGIADASPLVHYLEERTNKIVHIPFLDHHHYTTTNIYYIIKRFKNIFSDNKIILTTEKDAMRLATPELIELLTGLPLFYVPVKMAFHGNDKEEFNSYIIDYVKRNKI